MTTFTVFGHQTSEVTKLFHSVQILSIYNCYLHSSSFYGRHSHNFSILRIDLILLYGLEALEFNKSQISSIDFFINRFCMKLFKTNNIEIVKCCQQEFCFSLPSITLAHRTEFFCRQN